MNFLQAVQSRQQKGGSRKEASVADRAPPRKWVNKKEHIRRKYGKGEGITHKIKQNYFPPYHSVDRSLIKFSEEALYSVSHWRDGEAIVKFLKNILGEEELQKARIIDGTACVGGNTVVFAESVHSVAAVDIDKQHIDYIKHNMALYHHHNICYINGDITQLALQLCAQGVKNIMFVDPPWGGPDYKENDPEQVLLGGKTLLELVTAWFGPYDVIVLKIPKTFPVDGFCRSLSRPGVVVEVWKMYKYPCIAVYAEPTPEGPPPNIPQPR